MLSFDSHSQDQEEYDGEGEGARRGGGILDQPNFGRGSAIEVSKTYPFLIPIFPKCIPDFIPIFQKYIPDFIPIFRKWIPDPIPIVKIAKSDTVPYTKFRENRYRSLYQNRENRYPSRWHVPVPKICIVPPPPRVYNRLCLAYYISYFSYFKHIYTGYKFNKDIVLQFGPVKIKVPNKLFTNKLIDKNIYIWRQ